ncbi:hypothetical protein ACFO0N_15890 [Halobium salinum]|uniref:CARDB domain-containing protein n=1 Tax=Halobium salinum TaxID=1364940 RepID=A0ABD5PF04_9EURY|nr:hypothetical protein [Halobium salinum]
MADVTVADFETNQADDESLRVTATVKNDGEADASVTVRARVTAGKGKNEVKAKPEQQVDIAAGGTETLTFEFPDVPYARFERNGSLKFKVL